ncbi:YisL family protein [Bacillus changyiensis]|uniref:YisL family protein n=1 Tax=Bacillus changyiensis TaxID=3004103 RepID=UPI0022E43BE7|nr:YisL family protein [Bacillus changyiensis]MDA1475965.1 YisL family protein [Bacillus changyiensis]
MTTHWHITAWLITLILVVVVYAQYSRGGGKGAKITHMILRVLYLLVILTGVELFYRFTIWNGESIAKVVLGVLTIGLMEMLLIRKKKAKSVTGMWVGFIIVLLLTLALGLRLPLGFKIF